MSFLRKVLSAVGLLVFTAGLLVFVALAVGVWFARAEATKKTDHVVTRATKITNDVEEKVDFARKVLAAADEDLAEAKRRARASSSDVDPVTRVAATRASKKLAGSVDKANDVVVTASDAVVVADAALAVFSEYPELSEALGIPPDQLKQTRAEVDDASKKLSTARTVLGTPEDAATEDQLKEVERALTQARGYGDRAKTTVGDVRTKLADAKRKIDQWMLRTAIAVTVIGVLGALGQMSLIRSCWRGLTWKPEPPAPILGGVRV